MSVVPGIMLLFGIWIISIWEVISWGRLILGMLGYIIIYLSGMYFFVMNDYEKDVVRKPVQKVLRKIGIQK